jgi:hypothetical protein
MRWHSSGRYTEKCEMLLLAAHGRMAPWQLAIAAHTMTTPSMAIPMSVLRATVPTTRLASCLIRTPKLLWCVFWVWH